MIRLFYNDFIEEEILARPLSDDGLTCIGLGNIVTQSAIDAVKFIANKKINDKTISQLKQVGACDRFTQCDGNCENCCREFVNEIFDALFKK